MRVSEEVGSIYGDCESAFVAGMEEFRRGEFSFQEDRHRDRLREHTQPR
ncbi:MAG: hypothetical protein OXB99_08970 [Acidimicrobiaceae bacterium]|nr:hypothetical protein [Acidimicrobiaceae bacterium]